jgi:hypothetical protein
LVAMRVALKADSKDLPWAGSTVAKKVAPSVAEWVHRWAGTKD